MKDQKIVKTSTNDQTKKIKIIIVITVNKIKIIKLSWIVITVKRKKLIKLSRE